MKCRTKLSSQGPGVQLRHMRKTNNLKLSSQDDRDWLALVIALDAGHKSDNALARWNGNDAKLDRRALIISFRACEFLVEIP